MKGHTILHVLHFAGTRMQAYEIDRLLRKVSLEGVTKGQYLIPLVTLSNSYI